MDKLHDDLLQIILLQPGVQRVYWGREIENPLTLRWFVDWDDVENHKRFMNAEYVLTFHPPYLRLLTVCKCLRTVHGGDRNYRRWRGKGYHARPRPHPPVPALSNTTSPITEVVTMWFRNTYPQNDQDKVTEEVENFISIFENHAHNYTASAAGWVDEEIDIPGMEERGKAYVLLVGWTSVEAHMQFRETQAFKDSIHYVMGAKNLKKIEAVHVSLTEITK
ncbi:uncharacterized protein Z519_10747 [Cladophialophora bantiana CBS 173.52]|uniref:ABM domain-containing protein n=1 Tax=Cladophialophora bantiana (strain ATCC 10958 / CBS 173.52 / CDC B-1940 / NIH 8579) TaxID=1442370 RepID=A0A0D2EF33_CLAB1|nr:uncharacterized protein Z519_10747 [Cladophialophora bantiana CBS 173.52]KIW88701.1 hypothetical protein Z519_10747 [Cladophialophora bantiana CBS 173.52]